MTKIPWTQENVAELRARVAAGENVPFIATQIGRSQEATRARMQMLGLTKPRRCRDAVIQEALPR